MKVDREAAGQAFGRWRLLPAERRLLLDGDPVALGSRAFDILVEIVGAGGELVTKDALLRRVWPGTVVEENNLQVQMSALRKALGDDARLIVTIPGRGYRFGGVPEVLNSAPRNGPQAAPARERPALVVMPFRNLSGDPGQEYFADGITEDLTTALSHLRWFSVIARNSAFTYKGRAVEARQVGQELGVGYVLEGSVRRAGNRLRIAAQLCDTGTAHQVWGDHFDGDFAEVFDVQDRVIDAVVGAIEPNLREAEEARLRSKPTESLGAYDLYLRAMPHRLVARDSNDEAIRLLRRALALDPGFAAAKGALAGQLVLRVTQGWAQGGEVEEAVRNARELVAGGGAEDPTALAWAAHALAYLGRDYEGALAASNRAVQRAPNSAVVAYLGAWSRLYVGDWRTAVAWTERAIRLSPVDPGMSYFTCAMGAAYFVGEQYDAAAEWAGRAVHDRPSYLVAHRLLAASLAQAGRLEEARAAVSALLGAAPGYTLAAAAAHNAFRNPTLDRYMDGLRRAGLPE